MKIKHIMGIVAFWVLFLASCNGQTNGEEVSPSPGATSIPMTPEPTLDPGPRDFTQIELDKQDPTVGQYIEGLNIWDVPEYAIFKKYFPLTAEEERIVGMWNPIQEGAGSDRYQYFVFWPNKMAGIRFSVGNASGIWHIKEGKLLLTIYGVLYPAGDGSGYKKEPVTPYTVELGSLSDISSRGYTQKPFALVPPPDVLVKHFLDFKKPLRSYHFKALSTFDPTGGTVPYVLVYVLQDFVDVGNPSAEDIMLERIPNARDFW